MYVYATAKINAPIKRRCNQKGKEPWAKSQRVFGDTFTGVFRHC